MTNLKDRTAEELVIMTACVICLVGLVPFSIWRFTRGDLVIGSIDAVGALTTIVLFISVYRTRKVKLAGHVLALVAVGGLTAIVAINGVKEIHFLYPMIIVAYFLVPPIPALTITGISVFLLAPILVIELDPFQFMKVFVSLLGCSLFAYTFAHIRNRQRDELLHFSTKDSLTGALNRRVLNEKLAETLQVQQRTKSKNSLIILDLDNFKAVNDEKGHGAGDEILIRITETLRSRIRVTDSLFRYGGDEFVVLVNESDLARSLSLAEDLRARVEALEAMEGSNVSISLGVAEYEDGQSAGEWLFAADAALLAAKRGGRNQVLATRAVG